MTKRLGVARSTINRWLKNIEIKVGTKTNQQTKLLSKWPYSSGKLPKPIRIGDGFGFLFSYPFLTFSWRPRRFATSCNDLIHQGNHLWRPIRLEKIVVNPPSGPSRLGIPITFGVSIERLCFGGASGLPTFLLR